MCTFASMKRLTATISNWLRRFSYWKEHGDAVKPLYEGTTECKHCGTVFEGNFCPRCGQSRAVSKVTKHGFVMAFLEAYPQLAGTYLRTMWELLFRPGYMIRDYFRGHRVPYLRSLQDIHRHGFRLCPFHSGNQTAVCEGDRNMGFIGLALVLLSIAIILGFIWIESLYIKR